MIPTNLTNLIRHTESLCAMFRCLVCFLNLNRGVCLLTVRPFRHFSMSTCGKKANAMLKPEFLFTDFICWLLDLGIHLYLHSSFSASVQIRFSDKLP